MSMEWAQTNANRGFIASWPQFGGPAGIALANLAVLVFSAISGDQFLVWGWRIPFLLSIVMVAVGLYIRLGVLETPVFAEMVEEERLSSSPLLEVFRRQPKEVILSAFVRMGEQGPGYIYIAFIFTYGTRVLGVSRDLLLSGMVTAAILGFLWVPIAGHLSDRIGRRRMYIIGAIFSSLYGFVYFALLNTKSPTLIFIAVALSLLPVMTLYGPQAALIAESFAPRLRYSGAGLGYQLASIIAGGPAPFIATALLATYGSGYAVAVYIFACCMISIVSAALLQDHTNKDLAAAHEGV
jgi:MFS family permease